MVEFMTLKNFRRAVILRIQALAGADRVETVIGRKRYKEITSIVRPSASRQSATQGVI